MQQLCQNLKNGQIVLAEVAVPAVKAGHLLIQTSCSLISAGTERMLVEFGRGGYLAKARQQPEKVAQVLDKIRTDGIGPTLQSVMAKLDQPIPMGYSNVGRVLEVGEGVDGFRPGDRVVSNGPHAEVVMVPKNLAARVPDAVADDQATFTVVGAIALQGIRLIRPTLGETVAVFGLGLIGQLAVQILRAHGARVIGFDYDGRRVELARRYGAEAENLSLSTDPVAAAMALTGEHGVDGVLVTAATKSDSLMHQAAQLCRKRGRIVLTGVAGLNLRRSDFYEKELTFQVSCSYGPGRYDADYEQRGRDYPRSFVRWTEQRNFEAVLELMHERRLETEELISLRVPLAEAKHAYDAVAARNVIGVLLSYPSPSDTKAREALTARVIRHYAPTSDRSPGFRQLPLPEDGTTSLPRPAVCGLIGAGGFAQQKILPALRKAGARLKWVASSTGLSGSVAAGRFRVENSTTDVHRVLGDPEVDAVVIATRHNTHAPLVIEALQSGKAVFVEKPLCVTPSELARIKETYVGICQSGPRPPILMVGYNRRFASLTALLRSRLAGRTRPLATVFTCNAGPVPSDHWVQDPSVGGGRILGEACHFIDLAHFLADESPIVQVAALKHGPDDSTNTNDTVAISLRMADGSLGQIDYFANGPRSYPKERLEVFSEGRVFRIDNFKRLVSFGKGGGRNKRCWTQDKGHDEQFRQFVDAVRTGGASPIPFESLVNTAEATLAALDACRHGTAVELCRLNDFAADQQLRAA